MTVSATKFQNPGLINPPTLMPEAEPITGSLPPAGAGSTTPLPPPPGDGVTPQLPFGNGVNPLAPTGGMIPSGMNPSTAPVLMPGPTQTAPANPNDLGNTLIAPTAPASLTGAAEQWRQKFSGELMPTDVPYEALGGNRREALNSLLSDFDTQTAERDDNAVTSLGRRDAALGRLGSGMTSQGIAQIGRQSARDKAMFRNSLAADTIDKEFGDRFADRSFKYGVGRDNQRARTDAIRDAFGYGRDYAGLDYGAEQDYRNELRGERGYQDSRDAYATDRRIQERQLQEDLTNSGFNRDAQRYSIGTSGSPVGVYGGAAGDLSGQSGDTMNALMMYLQSLGLGAGSR